MFAALGLLLICFPSVSEGLFGQHEVSTTCRIRARMSSQTTASGLRESRNAATRRRPRSDLYRGLRGHVMHWNRKHLYRPSGTEICSLSDSSCQRQSRILDFFQKEQTLRAFHFLSLFFFFVFCPGQARRCQILSAAVCPQPLV